MYHVKPTQRGRLTGRSFTDLTTSVISLLPDDAARSDYDYSVNQTMLFTMATCHSLRIVDDELIGDPLDAKMFEFTGWSLEENEPRSSSSRQADRLSLTPLVAKPPPGFQMYVHGKASINAVSEIYHGDTASHCRLCTKDLAHHSAGESA